MVKEKIRKIVLWSIIIMCGLGIIGVGFELGTSDPAQTEPAVTDGQMSMVVVTTPVPIATIATVQTKAVAPLPTTVVMTASTTKPIQKSATSPITTPAICVPPKGVDYSFVCFEKPSGTEHVLIVENKGKTTLSKVLEITFKENGDTKNVLLSIEVPSGETKSYPIFTDHSSVTRITVARCS